MAIKAIETVYKGYRFRSRLEARWAVFFDALGIDWEYEKEGFNLGREWYLPDFYLPEWDYWLEIKPKAIDGDDAIKAMALACLLRRPVLAFCGDVWPDAQYGQLSAVTFMLQACYFPQPTPKQLRDDPEQLIIRQRYRWCECPVCHKIEIYKPDADGDNSMMHIECLLKWSREHPYKRNPGSPDELIGPPSPFKHADRSTSLMAAYTAARSARFEHGEKPRR